MRTISVSVLRYHELSKAAQERARREYESLFGYAHADEALETIRELAKHFGGTVTDFEIDWSGACSHSSMKFDMPDSDDMDESEIERRLSLLGAFNPETLKGHGDCVLTGVCYDEDAIDGFRAAWMSGKRDLPALMQAAFYSLLAQCHSEHRAFYDDEEGEFREHCEANGYEFYESGKFYARST